MKKAALAFLTVSGITLAALIYERLFVEKSIGPSAILGTAVAVLAYGFLLASYLLMDTRFRGAVINVWMMLVSTGVSYLLLDLIVGFFLIRPLSPPLVPDPYLHHRLVPNSFSKFQQPDFSYVQRVNNLGLRGEDVAVEKPAGTVRVLMLGDSFTMGKGVEDGETFSVLLDKALNREIGACGGRQIQVLNAGVDSYAPVLENIQLKKYLSPLKPDVVVLNLDVSDLTQEGAYRSIGVRSAGGEVTAVPLARERRSMTEVLREWTDQHLFFTRALLFYVNEFFGYRDLNSTNAITRADHEVVAHTLENDTVPRDAQWRDVFDSILNVKTHANSIGAEFVLSVYPWPHQVSDTAWVPGRYTFMSKDEKPSDASVIRVREFARVNDIPLADAFSTFRAYRGRDDLFFAHDMHWTKTGHQVMADSLTHFMDARYKASWCAAK
jgi:hypothetical protein